MKDPNQLDSLDHVDLTIEGNEDLSVRPWQGPSPFDTNPTTGTSDSFSRENLHTFIVSDEDLTVRPWRLATATATGSGVGTGPTEPQAKEGPFMKDPSEPDRLDSVDLTIEGNEDLSVRPWRGPSPVNEKLND